MKLQIKTVTNTRAEVEVDAEHDSFDSLRQKIKSAFKWPEHTNVTMMHQTRIIDKGDVPISTVPAIKDGDTLIVLKKSAVCRRVEVPAAEQSQDQPAAAETTQGIGANEAQAEQPAGEQPPATAGEQPAAPVATSGGPSEGAAAEQQQSGSGNWGGFNMENTVDLLVAGQLLNMLESRAEQAGAQAQGQSQGGQNAAAPSQGQSGGDGSQSQSATSSLTTQPLPNLPPGAAESSSSGPVPDLMRQLDRQGMGDSETMPMLLRALAEHSPELPAVLRENPALLLSFLEASSRFQNPSGADDEDEEEPPAGLAMDARQSADMFANLSQEDRDAVTRLTELGFSQLEALQAYLSCDKDENAAANLLFGD